MIDINCWEEKFQTCIYSDKLLNKLIILNKETKEKIDFTKIKQAIYYAKKYHDKQIRQTGEPYYSHPLEVAFMVSDYLFKTEFLVTSILHDTIEDTALTKEMISLIFGSTIANHVEDLTRIKNNKKISSAEIIESLYAQKKNDLLLIKIFDRLHNLQTIRIKSSEKVNNIISETLKRFLTASIYCNLQDVGTILSKLCCINKSQNNLLPTQIPFYRLDNEYSLIGREDSLLLSPTFRNKIIQMCNQE